MFCAKCGSELPEGAKFCQKCGVEAGMVSKDKEKKAEGSGNKKKALIASVAAILLFFAVMAYGFSQMMRAVNSSGYTNNIDNTASDDEIIEDSQEVEADYLQFKYYDDGTASVINIKDEKETISIPSEVKYMEKTYSVTEIGERAFNQCSSLTSVEIPDSVTEIGEYAFSRCSSLTSVEIPDSVTKIGERAFNQCSSLTSVEIPNGLKEIEAYVFHGCAMTRIEIPDGVIKIGSGAFNGCRSLTSVEIPDSVEEIGYDAFTACSLEYIVVGSETEVHFNALDGGTSVYRR